MACLEACLGRLGEGKVGEAFVFIVLRVLEPRREERSKCGHGDAELTSSSTVCWSFSTSTSLRLRFWVRCSFLTLVGLVRPVNAPAIAAETGEKTIGVELDRGFGWLRCSGAQELLVHGSLGGRRGTGRGPRSITAPALSSALHCASEFPIILRARFLTHLAPTFTRDASLPPRSLTQKQPWLMIRTFSICSRRNPRNSIRYALHYLSLLREPTS